MIFENVDSSCLTVTFSCLLAGIHNELHDRSRCTTRLDNLVNVWSLVASSFENINSCFWTVDTDLLTYRM